MDVISVLLSDSVEKERKYFSYLVPWVTSARRVNSDCRIKILMTDPDKKTIDWGQWASALNFEVIPVTIPYRSSYNDLMCSRFFAIRDAWSRLGELVMYSELDVVFMEDLTMPREKSVCLKSWDESNFQSKYPNTTTLQFPHRTQDHFIFFRRDSYAKQFFNLCCAVYQDCKSNNSYECYREMTTWQNGCNSENVVEIVTQMIDRTKLMTVENQDFDYRKFFLIHYPSWLSPDKRWERIRFANISEMIDIPGYRDTVGEDNYRLFTKTD